MRAIKDSAIVVLAVVFVVISSIAVYQLAFVWAANQVNISPSKLSQLLDPLLKPLGISTDFVRLKTGLLYFESALPENIEFSRIVGRLNAVVPASDSSRLSFKIYEQGSKTLIADIYYRNKLAAQLVFVRPYLEEAGIAPAIWKEPMAEERVISGAPKIAIIIDDIGQKRLDFSFLDIPYPLTFSVLPFTNYGAEFARRARAKGHDVMVHIPMEPVGYPNINPGRGALTTLMSDYELLDQLNRDLSQIALADGASNHMGSKFTQNEVAIEAVLAELKSRGLFFVDSRTAPNSLAFKIAKEIGLPVAGRDVFLDNVIDESAIRENILKACEIAKKRGYAVAIGHPHLATLNALKAELDNIKSSGIEVVPVSKLVR